MDPFIKNKNNAWVMPVGVLALLVGWMATSAWITDSSNTGRLNRLPTDVRDVNFVQAYRRASRGTRTSILRVTTLAYEDSIDQRKLDILASKSQLANKVDESRRVLKFW